MLKYKLKNCIKLSSIGAEAKFVEVPNREKCMKFLEKKQMHQCMKEKRRIVLNLFPTKIKIWIIILIMSFESVSIRDDI